MRVIDRILGDCSWFHSSDVGLGRFWMLTGVAIFLHAIADPALTYLTVAVHEVGYEANPILATPLNQSLRVFIIAHIPLWVISAGTIAGFVVLFRRNSTEDIETVVRYGEIVWSAIILWGMILVGNNLLILLTAFN